MKELYLERFTKLVYMQKKCPVGLARRARDDADFTKILSPNKKSTIQGEMMGNDDLTDFLKVAPGTICL